MRAKPSDKNTGRGVRLVSTPTLKDHGITKDQSSDWQKLAAIPEKTFEKELLPAAVLSLPLRTSAPTSRPVDLPVVHLSVIILLGLDSQRKAESGREDSWYLTEKFIQTTSSWPLK